jgi:23S rRNA pseudouridine955/2504/2580 synthase
MGLHAWKLELPHPVTGAPLRLEASFPDELGEVLSRANLHLPGGAETGGAGRGKEARPTRER